MSRAKKRKGSLRVVRGPQSQAVRPDETEAPPWLAEGASLEVRFHEVRRCAAAFEVERRELTRAVLLAREDGATWTAIGEALGVSRQAAAQRFGGAR